MKTILLGLTLASATYSAASINFNLSDDYLYATAGASVTFSGTVHVDHGYSATGATFEFASNGIDSLGGFLAPSFVSYLSSGSGDYAGDILTVTVPTTATGGVYEFGAGGDDPTAEIIVSGRKGATTVFDNEHYAVEVAPVPEPATFAALGLGGIAMLRRRKRA